MGHVLLGMQWSRSRWWLGDPGGIYQGEVAPVPPACLLLREHWAGHKGNAMGTIYQGPLRSQTWSPVVPMLTEGGNVARRRGEEQDLVLQCGNPF